MLTGSHLSALQAQRASLTALVYLRRPAHPYGPGRRHSPKNMLRTRPFIMSHQDIPLGPTAETVNSWLHVYYFSSQNPKWSNSASRLWAAYRASCCLRLCFRALGRTKRKSITLPFEGGTRHPGVCVGSGHIREAGLRLWLLTSIDCGASLMMSGVRRRFAPIFFFASNLTMIRRVAPLWLSALTVGLLLDWTD